MALPQPRCSVLASSGRPSSVARVRVHEGPMATRNKDERARRGNAEAVSGAEQGLLVLLAEQQALGMDEVRRFTGLDAESASLLVDGLVEKGLAERDQLLTGEEDWVWLTSAGGRAAGLSFLARRPRPRQLSHLRGITEARLIVEARAVEGVEWICERELRRKLWNRSEGFVPDAMVKLGGERHAIEVELSRKTEAELEAKLDVLESHYDRVVYFVSAEVGRFFKRLNLTAMRPKLIVREIPTSSRRLSRVDWRVPGDPAPVRRWGAPRLEPGDREFLDLVAEQGAIAMDQLEEFLGETEEAVETRVMRLLEQGLVRRAQPVAKEAPWVWLAVRGMRESAYDLSIAVPRLGHLEALRSANEVRLLVESTGAGRWLSRRVMRHAQGLRGSIPTAVVEREGERHSIDIWFSVAEPASLSRRFALRAREYDAVVWFYSRRAFSSVKDFAVRREEAKLVIRPIPKVDMSGLRGPGVGGRRRPSPAIATAANDADAQLWKRLQAGKPAPMRPILVGAVPPEAKQVIVAEVGREVCLRAAWQTTRKGARVYRLETDAGVFRAICSSWGWRVSAVRSESVFELIPGEPVDPEVSPPSRGRYVAAAPAQLEINDEVWAQVRDLIPPVERTRPGRGRQPTPDIVVVSGLIWMLRTKTPLSRFGEESEYGSGNALRARLRSWEADGVWEPLRKRLAELLPDGQELQWSRLPSRRR